MYKTPYNVAENPSEVLEFMKQNPFITLIGYDGSFPVATQIPVETITIGNSIKIIGHVMTKTDHCRTFNRNPNVLILYTAAHAYISASVYENPQSASTWNYKSVQAKGTIKLLDEDATYQIIKDITDKFEKRETSPAAFHKMDEDYIRKNLKAISGFEITVSAVEHVFKMSQGQSQQNRKGIISDLQSKGDVMSNLVAKEIDES